MKPLPRRAVWLLLIWCVRPELGGLLHGQSAPAQAPGAGLLTNRVNNMPPMPVYQPPTEFFRELLKMKPEERDRVLSNRPPQLRQKLEAKVQEYEAMPPQAREQRLRATELHEYLQRFIMSPPGDRAPELALIPEEYRVVVSEKLKLFDLLPAGLREEVLAQESTSNYFIGSSIAPPRPKPPMPAPPLPPDPLKSLSALSAEERAQLNSSFEHFFDLDDKGRQRIIAALPAQERGRVAKTLGQLESLPREQREQGLQAINVLVGMTDEQRQVFFRNAERWKAMSAAERETWLKLVSHLPPSPPMPTMRPPIPPGPGLPPTRGALSAVTNPWR